MSPASPSPHIDAHNMWGFSTAQISLEMAAEQLASVISFIFHPIVIGGKALEGTALLRPTPSRFRRHLFSKSPPDSLAKSRSAKTKQ